MKASFRAVSLRALLWAGFMGSVPMANGEPTSACVQASSDVSQAVSKDPKKVLLIVEDALVINESCACEIVRAAIQSSGANADMTQQIVQTAIAIVPAQSAMITECAGTIGQPISKNEVSPEESGKNPTGSDSSGKNPSGKNAIADGTSGTNPIMPEVSVGDKGSGGGGPVLGNFAGNVRGVYLVYPAAAVITTPQATTSEDHPDECCNGGSQKPVPQARSRRTRNLVALSPSEAHSG